MTGWSAPFAKRVLDSWAAHSKDVGAKAVADHIRNEIKKKSAALPSFGSKGTNVKSIKKFKALRSK